jgi:hypothetical protein
MAQTMNDSETGGGTSYCAWFGFWGQFVVLGLLVAIGGLFAGAGAAPGDETCGLLLALAALALAFLRIKARFDGETGGWGSSLFVDDGTNLILAIAVFVILGLGGAFVAAGVEYGGLYAGGVALFVVSALGVFFSLKNVFDIRDRRQQH